MTRPTVIACALALAVLAGCGGEIEVPDSDQTAHRGAELFYQRCSGCHTLNAAGTQGSSTNVRDKELTDGPNLNARKEDANSVLYAIRNGGFSGAIMPENIVVGADAEAVADFISKYAGRKAKRPVTPNTGQP